MNPPVWHQTIGNVCVGIAVLLYALPLQHLLLELSRKKDDGGGILAGMIILLPMWLLLLVALLCVTAGGGLDGLGLKLARGWLYPLTVVATLSMLALSFMLFEFPNHPSFFTRFIGRVPVYVFPVATMLFVVLALNPRFTATILLEPIKLTWLICAGISLLLCGGFVGQRLTRPVIASVMGLGQRISHRGPSDQEILAKIAAPGPQHDFAELLKRARDVENRAVREAATARLRTNPAFVEALAAVLESSEPSTALEFLHSATLSSDEQKRLALPARTALESFISDIPAPNYMSSDRRKQLLKWGRKAFPVIIGKFTGTDVDFSKVMPAFEHALRPDDTRRK